MWQQKTGHRRERTATGCHPLAQPVTGRLGYSLVENLIGCLARAGDLHCHTVLARRRVGNRQKQGAEAPRAGVDSPVFSKRPFGETVPLIGTIEMHAAYECRIDTGGAQCVCPSGRTGVKQMVVRPDLRRTRVTTAHEGHAAGHAQRRRAVDIVEAHAF